MNVSASSTTTSASESAARECSPARSLRDKQAFERALNDRAARYADDSGCRDEGADEESSESTGAPAFAPPPRNEAARQAPAATPPTAAVALDAVSGTRAALEAALNSSAPVNPVLGAAQTEQSWQVSLNEPGAALEIHATRLASGSETRATWALTLASPALSADAMARHAPQLTDRLRLRGIDAAHVRINEDSAEERGQGGEGRNGKDQQR